MRAGGGGHAQNVGWLCLVYPRHAAPPQPPTPPCATAATTDSTITTITSTTSPSRRRKNASTPHMCAEAAGHVRPGCIIQSSLRNHHKQEDQHDPHNHNHQIPITSPIPNCNHHPPHLPPTPTPQLAPPGPEGALLQCDYPAAKPGCGHAFKDRILCFRKCSTQDVNHPARAPQQLHTTVPAC